MNGIIFQFHSDEIKVLEMYRDSQQDSRLKLRFIALLMLAQGIDIGIVTSVIGKSAKSVENWLRQYRKRGIDSLNSFQYKPKQTFLKEEQIEQLIAWVKETRPAKAKQIREYIKDQFKVTYSVEAVRQLLHRHGLKVLRPKALPGGTPSEEEQKKIC